MRRQELISQALRQRYLEVCTNAERLRSDQFGEMAGFVSRQRTQLVHGVQGHLFKRWEIPKTWLTCEVDCLTALRVLAADEELRGFTSDPPGDSDFFLHLQASSRDPQQRFQLLTTRYRYPLNFVAPSEARIQEYLLERLMVADRARIERHSIEALNADDLLLRLNFVALNASLSGDLRFLDALNYYYELLPATWHPKSQYNWLLVSFLSFYARALSIHSGDLN
jgi:hypothetical protein